MGEPELDYGRATTDEAARRDRGDPRLTEGTWTSNGYESARTRAIVAMALLALNIGASVVSMYVLSVQGLGVVDGAQSGLAEEDILGWAEAAEKVAIGQAALYILTAVAFLAWLYRTVANVPHLGGGTPKWSPGWSVAWWFIPLASLVMPYLVMREVMRRLTAGGRYGSFVLIVWWIGFWAANFGARLVDFLPLESVDDFRALLTAGTVVELPWVIAALAAVWLIAAIERASDARRSPGIGTASRSSHPTPFEFDGGAEERREAVLNALLSDDPDAAALKRRERVSRGLRKLREQLDSGAITSGEYESKRADLLSGL